MNRDEHAALFTERFQVQRQFDFPTTSKPTFGNDRQHWSGGI